MTPRHLVHPVTGELTLFDVHDQVVSPNCGARDRRMMNVVMLLHQRYLTCYLAKG